MGIATIGFDVYRNEEAAQGTLADQYNHVHRALQNWHSDTLDSEELWQWPGTVAHWIWRGFAVCWWCR